VLARDDREDRKLGVEVYDIAAVGVTGRTDSPSIVLCCDELQLAITLRTVR
jgi:hypothetical protein